LVFRRINITVDDDVHRVFVDEVGTGKVSEAIRIIEEELVLGPEEERHLTIRARSRLVADRARKKLLEQRKLLVDGENLKIEQQQAARARELAIKQAVTSEIRRQRFRPEYIYDDQLYTWQRKRDELADGVTHTCQIDLTWKNIEPVVIRCIGLPKEPDVPNFVQEAAGFVEQDTGDVS
jgi:hypothetical protein